MPIRTQERGRVDGVQFDGILPRICGAMPWWQHKNVGTIILSDKCVAPPERRSQSDGWDQRKRGIMTDAFVELLVDLSTVHLRVAAPLATSTVDARIVKVEGSCQPMPPGAFG